MAVTESAFVLPLLVLVVDEELIEQLSLELELVICVLLDRLLVRDGVVLLGQKGLKRHHWRLNVVVLRGSSSATSASVP